MKQRLLTLALYFVVYTRLDPICFLHASGKQETACCLRANVTNGQTFGGNSSKINSAHILMLGRP